MEKEKNLVLCKEKILKGDKSAEPESAEDWKLESLPSHGKRQKEWTKEFTLCELFFFFCWYPLTNSYGGGQAPDSSNQTLPFKVTFPSTMTSSNYKS
jgi:hypothetical protein